MKKLIKAPHTKIFILPIIFACFACAKPNTMYTQPNNPITTNPTTAPGLKYLALGDSYTIGQSVQATDRFPAQTSMLLAQQYINVQSITYIATTGWTTANLMDAINTQNPAKNYDFVSLLIGVNDQYQRMDTATYRSRFTTLLNTSVALAGNRPTRVFVLSIPDYSATPFVSQSDKARVRSEVDQFNAINKQVTLANNIAYIDITPGSRDATSDLTLVASDGLHPSGKEYAKWAMMLTPEIKNALK